MTGKQASAGNQSQSLSGKRFFWKLWGSYAALVLIVAILVAALINRFFSDEAKSTLRAKLGSMAELAASMAAANPTDLWSAGFEARLTEVSENASATIDLVLASGEVIMASNRGRVLPGDPMLLKEMKGAYAGAGGEAEYEGKDGLRYLYVAVPILLMSDKIGYVRVGSDTSELMRQSRVLNGKVAAGAVGTAALSLLVGMFLTRSVTRPLRKIETACRRISQGERSLRIDLARSDEFGVVAQTVNRMADSIEQQLGQLESQRNRLELLLGLLRDSVVALDGANRILFMNQAAETLFSVSRSGVAGQPFADVIGISVMIDLIQNADARQSEQALEVQWEAGEETRYGSVYMAPLRIDEGGGPGWLIVIRDVTENRRFEALRRDFSSNVSHELKTPVAAIGALLDALKEGASDEPGTREAFLDRIRIQNERLARLIEELLAISRVEQDKAIFSWDRMDLRRVVELTRETFSAVADLRGIEFQVECGSEEVPVRGDSRALELLINSLVDNAFKYTKEGGRVLVRIEREKEVGVLVVEDTGIGIDPAHGDRIFERFYRIDASRSRESGGSGLGLAIVKHMVSAHGGTVELDSEVGKGSRFLVKIPLA